MRLFDRLPTISLVPLAASFLLAPIARADLVPDWITHLPIGTSLSAGFTGMVVDAAGNSYVVGTAGDSQAIDVLTASYAPDGTLRWSRLFDGTAGWGDQGRAITLGPGGIVWVTGNTPGPMSYANVILLGYDAQSGTLLHTTQYWSGGFTSEHGASVATDAQGNVYVAGGTTGDGGDVLVLKFDPAGQFLWKRTWDGPAFSPYSGDTGLQVKVTQSGEPVVLAFGLMSSLHPDYVVLKYDAAGNTLWQSSWGGNGEDSPRDMELDAASDVYVTGLGLDAGNDRFSTIKLRGGDGALLWQQFDGFAYHNSVVGLALDGQGGVYVTGRIDPDGDQSNGNDNTYTVKRDAWTGAQAWTHSYGANCLYCGDVPSDVAIDLAGHVFLAVRTNSPPYSGAAVTFVLDASSGVEATRGVATTGPGPSAASGVLRFDAAFNLYNGGGTRDPNTGLSDLSVHAYASLSSTGGTTTCAGDGSAAACPCGNASPAGSGRGCTSSIGSGARLASTGFASLAGDTLLLRGDGMPDSFVLYLQSDVAVAGGLGAPFGDGIRCVSGTIVRLGSTQNQAGSSQHPQAGDAPISVRGGVTAPGSRVYQTWYRNAAAFCTPSTFNLSNGWTVTWSS